ncbi:hypothetical protein SSP24_83730 [Streptomyces spinoverrucosus]|uniref:Uncharacterized protein n=1 Tax=Streptomyces spinoverrucosus TaxID=284043 RepID=A0A4Y3VWW3_9ACTN|nr:hypothetical protein SSP24_83730 [Streptomyces spinoverrucosus]GHB99777.1 hypothetical protein GCM10010397_84870 [Streptomyces spinoverrucosus]
MGGHMRHLPCLYHDGMKPPQMRYVGSSGTHATIDVGWGRCTLQDDPADH